MKDIFKIDKVRLKRCMDLDLNFQETVTKVKNMRPALHSGEPMIVSFKKKPTDVEYSYLLFIGRNIKTRRGIVSSPLVVELATNISKIGDVYNEYFDNYIRESLGVVDIEDYNATRPENEKVSTRTDVIIVRDTDGKMKIASAVGFIHDTLDEYGNLVEITTENLSAQNLALDGLYDPYDFQVALNQDEWNRVMQGTVQGLVEANKVHNLTDDVEKKIVDINTKTVYDKDFLKRKVRR